MDINNLRLTLLEGNFKNCRCIHFVRCHDKNFC